MTITEKAGAKILNITNPVACRIVSRVNRFVVKVRLEGDCYQACLNNTGRLGEFLVRGRQGFCLANEKPLKN